MPEDILSTYQANTATTAIYKDAGKKTPYALSYAMAGLTSECGELIVANSDESKLKEFGDVCWYIARICEESDKLSFEEVAKTQVLVSLELVSSNMLIGLASASDVIKKLMRDGRYKSSGDARNNLEYGLVTVFNACLQLLLYSRKEAGDDADPLELTRLALEMNVDKLNSRKNRQMISGSGDDR